VRTPSPLVALVLFAALALFAPLAQAEHLRDLADVAGARDNQLLGYGLVTGLAGTGDDTSVPFTAQSVQALLRRLGIQVDPVQLRLRNVAAVMVTATLPPFARQGTRIDVTVSSLGNARSLSGGVLVQTILRGADQLRLDLRTPGFTVASRVVAAINQRFGNGTASARDGGAVTVRVPRNTDTVEFVAQLEDLDVTPLRRARVVINERTGTIVAGGDVRLSAVAVVHGNLTITIRETPEASQPGQLSTGATAVLPRTEVTATDAPRSVAYIPAAPTLADVASALGRLGLSPRELASVLEALRSAGALEAELVIQ
jgi:flagellar P-ring protein precursor FlgI